MSYPGDVYTWPTQTLWIVFVSVNAVVGLVVLGACLWYFSRRRPAHEYSQRIGVQVTAGEVVNPHNTRGQLPAYSVTTLPVYSAVVTGRGTNGTTAGGEELVLVPMSALTGGRAITTTGNVMYYNMPPPPQSQPVSDNQSMDAIREASGVYIARPPPASVGLQSQQRPAHPFSPRTTLAAEPVSMSQNYNNGRAQSSLRREGEADAPELDEQSIHLRVHAEAIK